MIFGVRAVALKSDDLLGALRELIADFQSLSGIPVTFSSIGQDLESMSLQHKLTLLRLTQEGLSNVRAHARAKWVQIHLERQNAQVQLSIEDDGCGFDPELVSAGQSATHFGLVSMREGVQALNGLLTVDSQPGSGTRLGVVLPLSEEE